MSEWTLELKDAGDGSGDAILEFPSEILEGTGWREGDTIEWLDNGDGSWTLKKIEKGIETCWVLVDCVQQFRTRYLVQVPKNRARWALDTVTCEEAKEFSQKSLGETIVSHRVVTEKEALDQFRADTGYGTWTDEQIKNSSFTYYEDLE